MTTGFGDVFPEVFTGFVDIFAEVAIGVVVDVRYLLLQDGIARHIPIPATAATTTPPIPIPTSIRTLRVDSEKKPHAPAKEVNPSIFLYL